MEEERTGPSSAATRRQLRDDTSRRRPRSSARTSSAPRWLLRAAVLVALATATIAVPVLQAASPDAVAAAAVTAPGAYPSAFEVLAGSVQQTTPTSLLAALPATSRVSDTPSRSLDRDPLPGCDGEPRGEGSNGEIPASDLCALWVPDQMLRGDAAVALSELDLNYRALFGRDLCITDSYRSLADQRRLAYTKPGLAAAPGTSNHGWGLAIDLCHAETDNQAVMNWLQDNGPTYGWDNPAWARRTGSGPHEPWHWEYVPGTTELGTNWDTAS